MSTSTFIPLVDPGDSTAVAAESSSTHDRSQQEGQQQRQQLHHHHHQSPDSSSAPVHGLTMEQIKNLSHACIDAKTRAYSYVDAARACPYSSFRVGAALLIQMPSSSLSSSSTSSTLASKTSIVKGANVENAAYPSGTCAERVAINSAVFDHGSGRANPFGGGGSGGTSSSGGGSEEADGREKVRFLGLAVASDAKECCSPCGMCRQVLREFCETQSTYQPTTRKPSMPIFMHNIEGKYIVKTLGELLPMSFGPDSLPPPEELERSRRHED